jgi:FkbM family methyltransferase
LAAFRYRFHPLWRIRRTPWLHSVLARLDFPIWVKIAEIGVSMRIYWFRDLVWLLGFIPKEPKMKRVVEDLCHVFQPKVFWDVGANLGWYCWLVGAHSRLEHAVAIEPLPSNVHLLRATVERNRLNYVKVIESAIAERTGEVPLMVDTKSGAASQLKELYEHSGESAISRAYHLDTEIEVKCTTIDALIAAGEPPPDLMKIDVEEAEGLVFEGARSLIARRQTIFVFECYRPEATKFLKDSGYRIFAIDELYNFLALPPEFEEQASGITASLSRVD